MSRGRVLHPAEGASEHRKKHHAASCSENLESARQVSVATILKPARVKIVRGSAILSTSYYCANPYSYTRRRKYLSFPLAQPAIYSLCVFNFGKSGPARM